MDASAWIDLVLKRAKELRGAGVLAIGIDGCSATLAPAEPVDAEPPADRQSPEDDRYLTHPLESLPGGFDLSTLNER